MFFSPELLARRDSGFGLLWLAATLGSKSTFKKLPKKSVLIADIAQLCDLIAEPAEPLALRLSSNLMVGVARVYKVKQEIFMSDVTTCFNSLKKVVQEFQSSAIADAQLQMLHPNAKSSALTLAADPRAAFAMDFDNLVADWDEYLKIGDKSHEEDDDDDEFNPKAKQSKGKGKAKASQALAPLAENLRAELYTLKEHHDHLLSTSFDLSFNAGSGGVGGMDPSSSQAEGGGFDFNDNFFGDDGLDLGGGLDDLARELGEGWGGSPMKIGQDNMDLDLPLDLGLNDMDMDMGMDMGMDFDLGAGMGDKLQDPADTPRNTPRPKRKAISDSDKENRPPSSYQGSQMTPRPGLSPATSFSRLLLSQDEEFPQPLIDITPVNQNQIIKPTKKVKKTRLLLDARTELTDDELKSARAQYLEGQDVLRREIELKKSEKDSAKILDDLIWGVPGGIQAQVLVDFWQENFKVQVEARTGALHIHIPEAEERPAKRRKTKNMPTIEEHGDEQADQEVFDYDGMNMGMDIDMDGGMQGDFQFNGDDMERDPSHLRSSEDPGQGRRVSRAPSVFEGNFGFHGGAEDAPGGTGSQRSSLFPWDNAGGASSSAGAPAGEGGSDRISVDRAEIRLRGSSRSLSRRESSVGLPSQRGSLTGHSPAPFRRDSQLIEEDFAFDLPANNSATFESQQSENLITLERNSYNFLEYAKMQYQSLPSSAKYLSFDNVVPKTTSTRHVAAAAFYHCLVLATKDLLRLKQPTPYGTLAIMVA